jgi:hypothetical protein
MDDRRLGVDDDNMAKQRDTGVEQGRTRYEYRVWGKHRAARKLLEDLADDVEQERVADCYLIVDDATFNAKVRDNILKVKELVDENKGFEQWASGRHRSSDSVPSPFDDLFDRLDLDRPQRGKKYNLERAVRALRPRDGVTAVFVTKKRTRFRLGELRAEVADITLTKSGQVLRTLSIDGEDLDALTALRQRLGLTDEPNISVHQAIFDEVS